jgi:hypothetical protein
LHGKSAVFAERCGRSLMRDDAAFASVGVVAETQKKLLKKIEKHAKSTRHHTAVKNNRISQQEQINGAIAAQASRFELVNAQKIDATEKIFRVAYFCAKENMAFAKHPKIIQCHVLNGIDMGTLLYSRIACHDILMHTALGLRKDLVDYLISSNKKISIMVDESTTLSVKCALVIYIRTTFDDEVTNYFLTLVELQDKTGRGIAECILAATTDCGLSNGYLQSNLIGFCSDGASSMIGRHSGAAVCLQEILGVQLVSIHCMAHRLELAAHSVVKSINSVSHFKILCEEFHNVYAQSTKRLLELEVAARDLSQEILKIGKVFDVRWLMSSYSAVRALWIDLAPLQLHMARLADDANLSGKDKARFKGLKLQLRSWHIIAEIALMKDALENLSHFSLYLQQRDANILNVGDHLTILIRTLTSMKTECGRALKLPMTALTENLDVDDDDNTDLVAVIHGSNVAMRKPSLRDREMFDAFRKQFLQGLFMPTTYYIHRSQLIMIFV